MNTLRDDILDVGGVADRTRDLFEKKSMDYGESEINPMARFLGLRGQFSDINRKFWKLKRALWDGEELSGESAVEILMDLVGHCWLTIAMIEGKNVVTKKTDIDLTKEETQVMLDALSYSVSKLSGASDEWKILESIRKKILACDWGEDS